MWASCNSAPREVRCRVRHIVTCHAPDASAAAPQFGATRGIPLSLNAGHLERAKGARATASDIGVRFMNQQQRALARRTQHVHYHYHTSQEHTSQEHALEPLLKGRVGVTSTPARAPTPPRVSVPSPSRRQRQRRDSRRHQQAHPHQQSTLQWQQDQLCRLRAMRAPRRRVMAQRHRVSHRETRPLKRAAAARRPPPRRRAPRAAARRGSSLSCRTGSRTRRRRG